MSSYRSESPQVIVEFDASLFGAGVILYRVDSEGREIYLGSASFSLKLLQFFDDSSFQNTSEFIAAVMGLIIAIKYCSPETKVRFRGDSVCALNWLETGSFRSIWITKVATIFTYVCLRNRFHICESQHIVAADNGRADFLSRHVELPYGSMRVNAEPLLYLMDPQKPISSDLEYIEFWGNIQAAVDALVGDHPDPPSLTSFSQLF
jgi:hypothetical protein